ncbi:glycosyltransferase family 4 protein [Pelosinus propionicus]|uniref:Glycosyltransferase involved in cell wall bisynthesis n=1 Tax=Pelosinus propionicus DSM 13327 TaxID=1123291 RepID=A0A1I4MPM6_9FIRM|nr:glycosyltransferase family 4 protein [Pelosinus propionicus]SFM04997.1 Glycosyltransferase involved in cell wall bisynthesis [Pelosinus propionicus DSM 13327]
MLKVAVIVPSLQEKGPVIVAENIAKFNLHGDIQFIFVSLRNNSAEDRERFNKLGLKFVEVGMGKFPTYIAIKVLKEKVEDIQPNIIHAHSFWPTILTACSLENYIKVVTLHNNPYEDFYFEYGKSIGYFMCVTMKKALKYFDRVIAISEYVKEVHGNFKIEEKCEIIYNGIENRNDSIKIEVENNTQLVVVSASVLIQRKNILTALKTVNKLIQEGFILNYYILGDGKQKKLLTQYVNDNELDKVVHFLGKQPREKVFSYLKMADCVLVPSLSEGLPLSVIEAMMMQRAVIVSDIPAMGVIVENDSEGYLCNALDENEYYEAIIKMMNESNRMRLAQKAHQVYLEKFTVEQMSRKYGELYFRIAEV